VANIDISNLYFHRTPTLNIFSHVFARKSNQKEVMEMDGKELWRSMGRKDLNWDEGGGIVQAGMGAC